MRISQPSFKLKHYISKLMCMVFLNDTLHDKSPGCLKQIKVRMFISRICTLGWPKKKFCDGLELMGEIIIKLFYFYYFRFRQLFERALLQNQNQILFSMERSQQGMLLKIIKKNRGFFWLDQNMKNDVNSQEMLCNKISENPRFFFYNFQRHSLLTALHEKKNWFWFFEQRSLE